MGDEDEPVVLLTPNSRIVGFAQQSSGFGQRVEHGLQIEGRSADYLEHVGCGGLLLQGLGKIAGALSQLVQEARVLDGDDCLIGEARDQLDLLVSERSNLLAENNDDTN